MFDVVCILFLWTIFLYFHLAVEKSQDLSKLTDEQLTQGLFDTLNEKKKDEFLLLIEEAIKGNYR